MKKRWLLVSLIVCTLGLTGCTKALPITEEEEGMVAEFMAKELLESQEGYTQALIEPTEVPQPTRVPLFPQATAALVTTATPTVAPTVEPTNVSTGEDLSDPQANADIAQVFGMSDIKAEYTGYERAESITDNAFNYQATKGKDLFIIKFDVKNTSKKGLNFDLSELDISYQLNINTQVKIQPLVTLKDNDLRYIDINIKANKTREIVLMFEINQNLKIDNASLTMTRDNKTAIIKLK